MVDPQVMELGRVMSNSIVSNFFKIIFPIMILGGVIDLLVTLIFKKKKRRNKK
jgi:hypothetical protein